MTTPMNISELRNKLERKKGEKAKVVSSIALLKVSLKKKTKALHRHEQAQEIIKAVSLKTQEQLQYHINDITSLALEAIFIDPYKLQTEFVERRNKTECDLFFIRNGQKVDPLSASGGGTIDVASFALRIASWSMQIPHSRNTIILDEPFRFLSEDLQEKASHMIKEVSRRLGIQFIIITHNPLLTQHADKTFKTTIKKGITQIKTKTI